MLGSPNRDMNIEEEFKKLSQWLEKNGYSKITNEGKIICPICLQSKHLEDFTKEHIEPDSIGGKQLTITCKKCNSRCGHEFDYAVTNFLKHQQLSLSGPNCKSQISIGSIKLNVSVENELGSPQITVHDKNNNPQKLKDAKNHFDKSSKEFKLSTSAKWSPVKLNRAFIKMAQLMSIPQEGYRFVLSECGKKISGIILGKCNHLNISNFIHKIKTDEEHQSGYYTISYDKIEVRICIIKLERKIYQDYIYYMVVLPSDNCTWVDFNSTANKMYEQMKINPMNIVLDKS